MVCGEAVAEYGELDAAAGRLARLLAGRGAGPETVVAVVMERSAELVMALLAVLQGRGGVPAGGSGLPGGADRVHAGRRRARRCVVTAARWRAGGWPGWRVVVLDDPQTAAVLDGLAMLTWRDGGRAGVLRPDHAAYVMYTSGSTGRPKGVVVTHRGVDRLVRQGGCCGAGWRRCRGPGVVGVV